MPAEEFLTAPLECRTDPTVGPTSITGYATTFGTPYPIGRNAFEVITPTAFTDAPTDPNVFMLWNHDTSRPLARTGAGTLKLSVNNRGLRFNAQLPDTTAGRDAAQLVAAGVVDKVSVGFTTTPGGTTVRTTDTGTIRTVNKARLWEISLVPWPANSDTHAGLAYNANAAAWTEALFKMDMHILELRMRHRPWHDDGEAVGGALELRRP